MRVAVKNWSSMRRSVARSGSLRSRAWNAGVAPRIPLRGDQLAGDPARRPRAGTRRARRASAAGRRRPRRSRACARKYSGAGRLRAGRERRVVHARGDEARGDRVDRARRIAGEVLASAARPPPWRPRTRRSAAAGRSRRRPRRSTIGAAGRRAAPAGSVHGQQGADHVDLAACRRTRPARTRRPGRSGRSRPRR